MSAANRNRGARAEVQVVNYLRAEGWPDTRRYLAGDGRQPGDIDWHPLICLEVKDRAESCWPTWCRQTVAEAPAGTVPALVRRKRGTPDVGAWECRIHWDAWATIAGSAIETVSGLLVAPESYVDDELWVTVWLSSLTRAIRRLDAAPAVSGEGTA